MTSRALAIRCLVVQDSSKEPVDRSEEHTV